MFVLRPHGRSAAAVVLLLAGLAVAVPAQAAITLVGSASARSLDAGNVSTAAIDTTSANEIVVAVSDYEAEINAPLSDSKGNTWTALTASPTSVGARARLYYCVMPCTVGSGHTFTITQSGVTNTYPSIYVAAFAGVNAYDQQSSGGNTGAGSATSQATGSVTPPSNGALFVAGLSYHETSTISVDSGFTVAEQQATLVGSTAIGGALAYFIQGTAAAKNPSFSWTGATDAAAVMATFTATASGATTPCLRSLIGVGCEARQH